MFNRKRCILLSLLVMALFLTCFVSGQSQAARKAKKNDYQPITMKMIWYGSASSQMPTAFDYVCSQIKERYNVDLQIDFYDTNTYREKVNILWAAGDLPDFVRIIGADKQIEGVQNNVFVPLTDIVKNSKEWKKVNPAYLESSTFNGEIYSLPDQRPIPEGIFYRADWAKKLKLKVPTNPEEMYQMLYGFAKKDPDGNGKNDTYGLSMRNDFGMSQALWGMFLPAVPGYSYYDKTTDSIKNTLYLTDDMKKALRWFNRLYQEKVLDPEWVVDQNKTVEKKFVSGKTGIWIKGAQLGTPRQATMAKTFPGCDLRTIPTIMGPYGPNYKINARDDLMFLTTKCKDIARGKKIMEYMYSAEGIMAQQMGEKGKVWKVENGQLIWLIKDADKFYNPGNLLSSVFDIKLPMPDPRLEASMKAIKGYIVNPSINRFSSDPSVVSISTGLSNYRSEMITKMIIGETPIDQYDNFLAEYSKKGGDDVLAQVNKLYKASK